MLVVSMLMILLTDGRNSINKVKLENPLDSTNCVRANAAIKCNTKIIVVKLFAFVHKFRWHISREREKIHAFTYSHFKMQIKCGLRKKKEEITIVMKCTLNSHRRNPIWMAIPNSNYSSLQFLVRFSLIFFVNVHSVNRRCLDAPWIYCNVFVLQIRIYFYEWINRFPIF